MGPSASRAAKAAAAAGSSSSGTTEVSRPRPSAVAGADRLGQHQQLGRPGRADQPLQVHDAPESAPSPTLAKASSKLARSAAMRKSQANASDAPAPAATPGSAATTGFGIPVIVSMIGL